MKIARIGLLGVGMALALAFCATVLAAEETAAPAAKAACLYTCEQCHTVSASQGMCPMCKQATVPMHILGIKLGKAHVCGCDAKCGCTMAGVKNDACSCGKPVKVLDLKGLYVCACGEGCTCNTVSDKPGNCHCGKELKKVETPME